MRTGIGKNRLADVIGAVDGCNNDIPTSTEYLASLSTLWLVVFGFMGLLTCSVVAIYIEQVVYLFRKKKEWKLREKAKWVLLLYPMMAVPSFVGLMVPRSAYLSYLITSVYVSLVLYIFVTMLIGYFGGAEEMSQSVKQSDLEIRMNTTPLCCCCPCLPKFPVSVGRLRLLKFMVLQFAHIRPVVGYILAVIYADRHYGTFKIAQTPNTYLDFLNTVSSLTAAWGLKMTFVLAKEATTDSNRPNLTAKFLVMYLVVLIEGLQQGVVNFFVYVGVISCTGLLSAQSHADKWNCLVSILEAFILSVVARHFYRQRAGEQVGKDGADKENVEEEGGAGDAECPQSAQPLLGNSAAHPLGEDHTGGQGDTRGKQAGQVAVEMQQPADMKGSASQGDLYGATDSGGLGMTRLDHNSNGQSARV